MRHLKFAYLLAGLLALLLVACHSAEPPPTGPEVVQAAATPTPIPTVALITVTPTPVNPTPAPPTPTATRVVTSPTPSPTPTPLLHEVQEGDTLLGLAVEYGVTVEDLTAANGMNEADFLQIGQQVIIPVTLEPPSDSSFVSTDTPIPAPATHTPAPVAAAGDVSAAPNAQVAANPAPAQPAAPPSTPLPPLPQVDLSRPANTNPLTGLPVDNPASLQRRPLLVRIGNDVGARASQAGLNSADIVYEEITEWWVTRFTAIYLAETPNTVAPIRSARLINVQLGPQYQGALAHSGGSDPVRWEISQAPLVNLDEYFSPQPYYYRENEGWQTRLAIDTAAARSYLAGQGTEKSVSLIGFLFSEAIDQGEPGDNIFIPYPRATTFTQWRFDPAGGKYLRFANDQPLVDANSGQQVAASNVIIYFAEHQETDIVEDSNGATSIRIIVNGRGPAWFFRDGKLNKGFWQTDGARTPYFGYNDGSPYPLKPGNTWVEVVPTYYKIGINSPDEASSRP